MAFQKLERSWRTPDGWRLATVEEAKQNLESIRRDNLLGEWDKARLLNGWIGGSGYDFNVQEGFRSCLGYMLVVESPTPEIVNTDDRNAVLYSEVPKLSNEGRNAAALLCGEDWNKEVLYWLIPGETEEGRARENAIWENDETKAASELVSAIAREWQGVCAKCRVPTTELSLASVEDFKSNIRSLFQDLENNSRKLLEDLTVNTGKSLKAIMNPNSGQRNIPNEILEKTFSRIGDKYLSEMSLKRYLKVFEDSGFDTSVPSTWEAVAHTVWYVAVETVLLASFSFLCHRLYNQVVMHSETEAMDDQPILASLIYRAYELLDDTFNIYSDFVEAAATQAKGNCKQFDKILRDQWFPTLSCKGKYDVLGTFLVQAAENGDVNLVKRLIESGVQPSATDYVRGFTGLHHAAILGDQSSGLKIAEMLLKEDKSLANAVDIFKRTPLHGAAYFGYAKMCTLFLHHNASVTSKDNHGRTPIHYAFMDPPQNEELIRVLISAEGKDSVEGSAWLVDVKDEDGKTPLDYAIECNANVNMVAWLLSLSSQPESYFKKLHGLSLYVRESSRMGYKDLVQKLLNEGADPFDPDDEGKTAVHYAAEGASQVVAVEIIQKLLFDKKQASINVEKASAGDKYGRNVLHVAAFLGWKELCRFLLDLDRNMIDSKDRDGQSAIYYAVAGPHDDSSVLGEFISRKQRRNQAFVKDFSQTTPLHMAAARGNLKMVDKLLSEISAQERNNYVEAADVLGQTALHKAASGGHEEIVKKLLASGAHPLKQRDCDGKRALHFAAQADGEDAVQIAKLLLDKCESDKQKSLLLFASAVGIGLRSNSSLEKYLEEEKRKILEKPGEENLLRVAATLGDIDMTREFITRGANIAIIRNEKWINNLPEDEKEKVRDVLEQIDNIVEQGTDKPALRDDLGRTPFAIGLAALFLNPYVKSPVTVGISGEWGMGKSSVMVQTESILLKTAAQLAFPNSFKKEKFPGASESKLSVTGQARRKKIANAIDAESGDGPKIIDSIGMSIKQVKNFTEKVLKTMLQKNKEMEKIRNKQASQQAVLQESSKSSKATKPQNCSRLRKFWNALQTRWKESALPENFHKFNEFLENYQPKFHQIFKSLAIMDRRDMFEEEEESGSGNQRVGETPWEQESLEGTTPSILTVQYNAWHYRNETEAWAGLAVEITKELEATMTVAHKLRTSWIYNWKNRKNSICFGVILPFFLALMVAIWFSTIVWFLLDTAQRKDLKKFKYGGLPASMIVAAWGLGKSVISFVKPISSQVVDYICLPDHSQKLGYHQKVIDDINFLKDQLRYKPSWKWEVFAFIWCCITWSWDENYVPGTKIPKMPPAFSNNLRIIVFVDDLDRCEENVILQVLSAVNLVLAACEINVILSMEKTMIQRAIIRKYGNNNSNANNKSNEDLADNYLRKIVQLPLHLADPSDSESRDFLQSQLGRKRSTDPAAEKEKYTAYGRRKANPKFQIGTSDANKPKLGRGETKKDLAESGAKQQRALSISDRAQEGSGKMEEQETIKKLDAEGSGVADATFEIDVQQKIIEKAERVSPITQIYRNIQKCLCNVRTHNPQSGVEEAMIEIDHIPGIEQSIKSDKQGGGETKKDLPESGAEQQTTVSISDTVPQGSRKTEEEETIKKPERVSPITQIYRNIQKCLCNVRTDNSQSGVQQAKIEQPIKRDEQGDKHSKDERSLSLMISAMLIPKYSEGERNAFCFLHTRCTRNRKLPREWKCLMAYHRLAWNILSLSPDVIPVEGWQVQLIAWIFVCWQWRDLMTTLIQNWNNLGVLKKWKVVEESSGPSLREIVEQYIDERWPAEKKSDSFHRDSATKEKDDAIDSLNKDVGVNSSSSTKEVEKTSESSSEGNMRTIFSAEGTEGDDYLKAVLRKVLREQEDMREILRKSLKEQEEMREALRKNMKEQEEMRDILEMIKKKVFEEEEDKEGEESSLQQYTTAKEKAKDEKEEREEWIRLSDTLRSFNVSMDGIQAFQKFRFYCEPGYLPWPLPEQT